MSEIKLPHLYTDLAPWFHLLTHPSDYREEASIYHEVLSSASPNTRTLLEIGSGGGNNALHLKQYYEMTLVDLSPAMLSISQKINPDLPHLQGDMRTVRLGQTFDAVFIHDAVMYITTEDDLRQTVKTVYTHTRPGGAALFVPDHVKETFHEGTEWGGHDGQELGPAYAGLSLRYLEWSYDPDPNDTTYIVDFSYLLRRYPDDMKCVYDRHICGIFPRETWLRLFREAGFEPKILPFEHSEVQPGETEMILGIKPAA